MATRRREWMKSKCNIALRLDNGDCGASYDEAIIVLCAAISSVAAECWPKCKPRDSIDKARFVELLKDSASPSIMSTHISVPLLIDRLYLDSRASEVAVLRQYLPEPFTILTGTNVDKSEVELRTLCPSLPIKDIRSCSYANILYEEVRSGYMHKYKPSDRAESWPITAKQDQAVSYVNVIKGPYRRIHFHIEWVAKLAMTVAESADCIESAIPLKRPLYWWIHGKQT